MEEVEADLNESGFKRYGMCVSAPGLTGDRAQFSSARCQCAKCRGEDALEQSPNVITWEQVPGFLGYPTCDISVLFKSLLPLLS